MNEWGVVGVIIALIGLISAVMGPAIYITRTLSKLTVVIEAVQKDLAYERDQAVQTHQKIWSRLDEHADTLADHDKRIYCLEQVTKEP